MRLSTTQRDLVRGALSHIRGLPLTDMWRYAGFQKLEFGEQRPAKNKKGQDITQADRSLVLGCSWRFEGPDGFILSDEHFGEVRKDQHAKPFYELLDAEPLVILEIEEVFEDGGFRLSFTEGYSLIARITYGGAEWRYMSAQEEGDRHFVVSDAYFGWV